MNNPIVITSAARTPIGNLLGIFKSISSPQLGSVAIKAALERSKLQPHEIDDLIMGCVLIAGLGQAPAKQASLGAGLPTSTPCTTINKMCGSGLKAIMFAHDLIKAESSQIMIAGGMESMTQAPYLALKARAGYRLGHSQLLDHMFYDGLEDPYDKGKLAGYFAELCVQKYQFTRQQQDEFATTSVKRAQEATQKGLFKEEITPVTVGEIIIDEDEGPKTAKIDKIPTLKPSFIKDGTVTPANSSSISDGAAAVVLMHESEADKRNLKPLARILGHATFSKPPAEFTTAPIGAIQALLKKLQWTVDDVDLFEINEAFAAVVLAAMHDLKIPHEKVNIHGGACVLGHPIGASGARVLTTLIYALKNTNKKYGVAAVCLGGGEAVALAIEMI